MFAPDFYQRLLDGLSEGVYFVDLERRILYWNEAAERITGYRREVVLGRSCQDGLLCHVDDSGKQLCQGGCPMAATITCKDRREAHVYLHHAQGHRVPVRVTATPLLGPGGEVIGAVESFVDDSEWKARDARLSELERYAFVDALTELPNRRYLDRTLDIKFEEMKRYGWPYGVLMIDVDHFKSVNDKHGHEVGDAVLRMVARTLQAAVRGLDSVGRWGGEEFLVILSLANRDGVSIVAERIRALVASCQLKVPVPIAVTVSVGGAVARAGESALDVARRADESLYRAKQDGRNRVHIADEE
jgi:diguanylate cyclase (GGDEF)-like protein/PAS domain S-box-containing protein